MLRGPKWLRYWLLDAVAILLVAYLAYTAVGLVQKPSLMNIALLCFFATIALRLGYELIFKRGDVPISASSFFERRKIAGLLQEDAAAQNKSSYTVVDLGCGRGELTRCIARALPNAQVIGVEQSPVAYTQAVFLQRLFGFKNLTYKKQSLFSYDCTSADAVVLYLGDGLTKQAGDKLARELKSGAMIISNEFPLLGVWQPLDTIVFHKPFKASLLVYRQS